MSEATENHTITNIGAGIAKAVIHTNPITGFVQTIYDECASRQWQQRREKWEEVFEEKLKDIQNDVDFQKIMSIPNFAQILANATQGAMSDIEEDKVDLYVNTVINTIKNEDINNTKTHIFLNMLRNYTLLHIEILKFYSNPTKFYNEIMRKTGKKFLINDIRAYWGNYKKNEIAVLSICKNLISDGLLQSDYIINHEKDHKIPTFSEVSVLGREFLQFISEQDIKNK